MLRNLQRVALQGGDGSLAHIAYSESAALDFLEKRRRGEKAKSSTKNRLGSSGRPKGGSENRVATSNKSTGCDLGNIVTTRGPGVLIVGDVVQQVSKVQDVSVITTTDCRPIELRFEAADGSYSGEYTIPANYGKNHSILEMDLSSESTFAIKQTFNDTFPEHSFRKRSYLLFRDLEQESSKVRESPP